MTNKLKIVVSDCHLGKGHYLADGLPNHMEDFYQDDKLCELLQYYSIGEGRSGADEVELVINGDFFDYLTVDVSDRYPNSLTEDAALYATQLICDGHRSVVDALKRFTEQPGCHVLYQMGNHDPALAWPAVQQFLRAQIGDTLRFSFENYCFDDVRIEHGHQREVMHQFDTHQLVLEPGPLGRTQHILNLPFGCFFVIGFVTKMRLKRRCIGEVVPFRLYLRWAALNDFWFFVSGTIAVSLFFIKMRFIRHPQRYSRFSKTVRILRDILRPPRLENIAHKLLQQEKYRVLIMGHNHEAVMRLYPGGKQYVNSGTWCEFTSFDPGTLGRHLVLSYIVLEKNQQDPWRVELKRWNGRQRIEETLSW